MNWVQVIAEWGVWSTALGLALRSRPARTVGRVFGAEIQRRYEMYLRRCGVPQADIRRLLDDDRDRDDDQGEPPKAVA